MNSSRRSFLKAASVLGAAAPLGVSLWNSPAWAAGTDYRALVSVFLYGGNDNGNMLVPTSTAAYRDYAAARTRVALAKSALGPTTLTGQQLALNPGLAQMASLYNSTGKVAVLANVGPLVEPTRRDPVDHERLINLAGQNAVLPTRLRSHNDQQAVWQTFAADGSTPGWGGRFNDLFTGAPQSMFRAISVAGDTPWIQGVTTKPYQVSTKGPIPFVGLRQPLFGLTRAASQAALLPTLTSTRAGLFERALNAMRGDSVAANDLLSPYVSADYVTTNPFPGALGAQLKMVLQLMKYGKANGLRRQVFHVALGGFDHHDGLLDADTGQSALLSAVDGALSSFFLELTGGAHGVDLSEVTTFTASDFGRTMEPNTDGSDHGWGGHHLIFGGSVLSGVYGRLPGHTDVDEAWWNRGTLIPGIATQQYAYTLGRWFGIPEAVLATELPNLAAFPEAQYPRNLGFLA